MEQQRRGPAAYPGCNVHHVPGAVHPAAAEETGSTEGAPGHTGEENTSMHTQWFCRRKSVLILVSNSLDDLCVGHLVPQRIPGEF